MWYCNGGDCGKLFRIIAPFLPSVSPTPFAVEVMTFSFIEQRGERERERDKEEADRPTDRPTAASTPKCKAIERECRFADATAAFARD